MTAPWQTIATAATVDGTLELRRRQDDWLMVIDGRVLMNSFARASEEALAHFALQALAQPPRKVMVSGLGMGFTLRALCDRLPARARVTCVELNPIVVEWCRGPLAVATRDVLGDARVEVVTDDVAAVIARAQPASYDAIVLDLYEGPNAASQRPDDPFYGVAALSRARAALAPRGVLAIWAEDADAAFSRRFATAGFAVAQASVGRGGRRHIVYTGTVATDRARPRDARAPRR